MGEDKDGGAGRESWSKRQDQHRTDFEKPPSALGPRVGAWVLWLVGLALEASCVLYATGVIAIPGVELPAWLVVAVALVLDLVLVLVAASLWKKAARRAFQAGAAGVSAGGVEGRRHHDERGVHPHARVLCEREERRQEDRGHGGRARASRGGCAGRVRAAVRGRGARDRVGRATAGVPTGAAGLCVRIGNRASRAAAGRAGCYRMRRAWARIAVTPT